MWGFNGTSPGPLFETRSGQGLMVEWANQLPAKHFLPIDHTLHGAEADQPEVRCVVHLHGGRTPPKSDGYPEDWVVPGNPGTTQYFRIAVAFGRGTAAAGRRRSAPRAASAPSYEVDGEKVLCGSWLAHSTMRPCPLRVSKRGPLKPHARGGKVAVDLLVNLLDGDAVEREGIPGCSDGGASCLMTKGGEESTKVVAGYWDRARSGGASAGCNRFSRESRWREGGSGEEIVVESRLASLFKINEELSER